MGDICANDDKEANSGEILREKGADGGAHDMEGEEIVEETDPAASSTLRKECKSVIREVFKKMAPLYSIYDVYFRNYGRKLRAWHF